MAFLDKTVRASPHGGPWRIAGASDDGQTVDIADDEHTVCIGLWRPKAELLCAEHNVTLPEEEL